MQGGEPIRVDDPGEALSLARETARAKALEAAVARGGAEPHVEIHVDRVDIPGFPGDSGLMAATVIAECWAAPRL